MRRNLVLCFSLAIVIVASAAVFTKMRVRSAPPYPAGLADLIQAGIASEAPCPTSVGGVPQAVENAASFITYRSGVNLSEQAKQKLKQLEQNVLSGSTDMTGLSRQQVKDIVIATFMNTANSVTDSQITDIANNSLRVMSCVVDNRAKEVQLRASKGNFDSELFRQKAALFRDGSTPEGVSLRDAAISLIGIEVDTRLDALAFGCPNQWNVKSYSPYRVFILTYALMSDDSLAKSQSGMASQMQSTENWIYTNRSISCPSIGRCPFGDNGYIYCTPMSIFFSQGVQTDLLNRIQAILG